MVPCYFTAAPGEVKRDAWRDVSDPAPEPKPAAGAGAAAEIVFADGFENFDRKSAATELLR